MHGAAPAASRPYSTRHAMLVVHVVFPHVFRGTLGLEKLARFAPREQLRGILRR